MKSCAVAEEKNVWLCEINALRGKHSFPDKKNAMPLDSTL